MASVVLFRFVVIFFANLHLSSAQLANDVIWHRMLQERPDIAIPSKKSHFVENVESLKQKFTKNEHLFRNSLSDQCALDVIQFLSDLDRNKTYTVVVLDSFGKPGSGIIAGNTRWVGSFDLCRQISVETSSRTRFDGKHCTLQLGINIGICIPDSCTLGDANTFVQALYPDSVDSSSDLSLPGYCYEDQPWTGGDIAAVAVLSLFALLSILGTTHDALLRRQDEKSNSRIGSILLCFSWLKNGEKLFSTRTSSDQLGCLNGLRTLSMFWVMLGHTVSQSLMYIQNLNILLLKQVPTFEFQVILSGDLSVDTFFFLSGLLVGYLTLKALAKPNANRPKFWGLFYFHRFWRLTPVYMLCTMFAMTLLFHLLQGPLVGPFISYLKEPCEYWWTNLLYINNFHPNRGHTDRTCMSWAWYLANDMQFFVLSPFLIIPLRYFWKTGIAIGSFLVGACVITTGVLAKIYSIYFLYNPLDPDLKDGAQGIYNDMYVRPYFRLVPYVVGLLLGGIIIRYKDIKLHWLVTTTGWILAFGFGMSLVYGYLPIVEAVIGGDEYNKDVAILFFTMKRLTWSIAIAWLVFACITGNGGPVNWFLSWKIWIPFARLTYCAYLVHPMVIFYHYLNQQVMSNMDPENIIYKYAGFISLSYLIAAIVSLTLESPFMALEKVMLGGAAVQVNKQQPCGEKSVPIENGKIAAHVNSAFQFDEKQQKDLNSGIGLDGNELDFKLDFNTNEHNKEIIVQM